MHYARNNLNAKTVRLYPTKNKEAKWMINYKCTKLFKELLQMYTEWDQVDLVKHENFNIWIPLCQFFPSILFSCQFPMKGTQYFSYLHDLWRIYLDWFFQSPKSIEAGIWTQNHIPHVHEMPLPPSEKVDLTKSLSMIKVRENILWATPWKTLVRSTGQKVLHNWLQVKKRFDSSGSVKLLKSTTASRILRLFVCNK